MLSLTVLVAFYGLIYQLRLILWNSGCHYLFSFFLVCSEVLSILCTCISFFNNYTGLVKKENLVIMLGNVFLFLHENNTVGTH